MNKAVLHSSVALLALALVAGALLARRTRSKSESPSPPLKTSSAPPPAPRVIATANPTYAPPASKDLVAVATYEAKVRTTYDNYRTAVATGNGALAEALLPALLRDRAIALRVAKHELRDARTTSDRDVAAQVLNSLERSR